MEKITILDLITLKPTSPEVEKEIKELIELYHKSKENFYTAASEFKKMHPDLFDKG